MKGSPVNNYFLYTRWESTVPKVHFWKPIQNHFIAGYGAGNVTFEYSSDLGQYQDIQFNDNDGYRIRGGSPFVGSTNSSETYPSFLVIPLDSSLTTDAQANYTAGLAVNGLKIKRVTDVKSRLETDNLSGKIKWGDGTNDPVAFIGRYVNTAGKVYSDSILLYYVFEEAGYGIKYEATPATGTKGIRLSPYNGSIDIATLDKSGSAYITNGLRYMTEDYGGTLAILGASAGRTSLDYIFIGSAYDNTWMRVYGGANPETQITGSLQLNNTQLDSMKVIGTTLTFWVGGVRYDATQH
jgi:hypothetical protein